MKKTTFIYPRGTYKRPTLYFRGGDTFQEQEYINNEGKRAISAFKESKQKLIQAMFDYKIATEETSTADNYTLQIAENLGENSRETKDGAILRQRINDAEAEIDEIDAEIAELQNRISPANFLPLVNEQASYKPDLESLEHQAHFHGTKLNEKRKKIAEILTSEKYSYSCDSNAEFLVALKCRNMIKTASINKFSSIHGSESKEKGRRSALASETLRKEGSKIGGLLDEIVETHLTKVETVLRLNLARIHEEYSTESLLAQLNDMNSLFDCGLDMEKIVSALQKDVSNDDESTFVSSQFSKESKQSLETDFTTVSDEFIESDIKPKEKKKNAIESSQFESSKISTASRRSLAPPFALRRRPIKHHNYPKKTSEKAQESTIFEHITDTTIIEDSTVEEKQKPFVQNKQDAKSSEALNTNTEISEEPQEKKTSDDELSDSKDDDSLVSEEEKEKTEKEEEKPEEKEEKHVESESDDGLSSLLEDSDSLEKAEEKEKKEKSADNVAQSKTSDSFEDSQAKSSSKEREISFKKEETNKEDEKSPKEEINGELSNSFDKHEEEKPSIKEKVVGVIEKKKEDDEKQETKKQDDSDLSLGDEIEKDAIQQQKSKEENTETNATSEFSKISSNDETEKEETKKQNAEEKEDAKLQEEEKADDLSNLSIGSDIEKEEQQQSEKPKEEEEKNENISSKGVDESPQEENTEEKNEKEQENLSELSIGSDIEKEEFQQHQDEKPKDEEKDGDDDQKKEADDLSNFSIGDEMEKEENDKDSFDFDSDSASKGETKEANDEHNTSIVDDFDEFSKVEGMTLISDVPKTPNEDMEVSEDKLGIPDIMKAVLSK